MLHHLSIRNIVTIETLDLDFGSGLTVMTGETGTGKSILLDSLNLVMGGRAQVSLVRKGTTQASVTASFEFGACSKLKGLLSAQGIEVFGDLILRRVIKADGKSRAFVNDTPVSNKLLRDVGACLAEIQGQFESHSLLQSRYHRTLLDIFAGNQQALAQCTQAWRGWRSAETAFVEKQKSLLKAKEDEEYLLYTLEELRHATPQIGEYTRLGEKRLKMQNIGRISQALSIVQEEFSIGDGLDTAIGRALRALERCPQGYEQELAPILASLENAMYALEAAQQDLQALSANLEEEPRALEQCEERLFMLRDLATKHGCEPDDLPEVLKTLEQEVGVLDEADSALEILDKARLEAREGYKRFALIVRNKREKAALKLDKAIQAELLQVKLERARFITRLTKFEEERWSEGGMEGVDFSVATNPGEAPGPLGQVASGGELSRFLLALKVVLSNINPVPTLIFDEVDAGLGGATANAVAERLRKLAQDVQVLVITHSAQVASHANTHFQITKTSSTNRTASQVKRLSHSERIEEIARMISGAHITDTARAAARELLEVNA